MQVVERKPVPIYEVICVECESILRYQASEVQHCHITCPVCRTSLWVTTDSPVAFKDTEPPKEET